MQNTIIEPEDSRALKSILESFLRDSGARAALLINRNGFILARAGDFAGTDPTSLAVLASGSLSSTQALAKIIGEKEFAAATHQGKHTNVHISIVSDKSFIAAVADSGITASVVRLYAREAIKDFEPILAKVFSVRPQGTSGPNIANLQG